MKNAKEYIDSLISRYCPNGKTSYYTTDQIRNQISQDRDSMRANGIDYFDCVEYLANHWGVMV